MKLDRRSRCPDQRIRCRVVLKVAAGLSCNAAARALGCAPATAVRIVARFQREGEAALWDGRLENGVRKIDADVRDSVREILTGTPEDHGFTRPTWTLEILRGVVEAVLGVALSLGALWTLLRQLGVRWGRPRPIVACPWKARRRQRRIAALKQLAALASDEHVVVYADEVDIHLNPKIGPDWMLPGTQRRVLTPGNNEKRDLAGAYEPLHERLVYVEGDRKASWIFLNLLRALLEAYAGAETIHVILDNYIIHKSQVTQAWLAEFGDRLRLHFLPPYCPNENRIERLWLDLHANVTRNHRHRTIDGLLDRVHGYLAARFNTTRRLLLVA
ncbi:MAG TPA: IS630 family transposase [Anaeromyxobacteraceae bacterium]|nr:IS630 family transposase [Anaeromyxobacteraceae bacterium]